jgi:hypothetical protein
MHMNSVPQHLLSEDRQEYERVLDEALRSAPHRPELAAVGQRLNPEQLRTMALNATALITVRAPSPSPPSSPPSSPERPRRYSCSSATSSGPSPPNRRSAKPC